MGAASSVVLCGSSSSNTVTQPAPPQQSLYCHHCRGVISSGPSAFLAGQVRSPSVVRVWCDCLSHGAGGVCRPGSARPVLRAHPSRAGSATRYRGPGSPAPACTEGGVRVLTYYLPCAQGRFGVNGAGLAECPRCRGSFVEVLTGLSGRRCGCARPRRLPRREEASLRLAHGPHALGFSRNDAQRALTISWEMQSWNVVGYRWRVHCGKLG